jgi:hypothetical protein
MAKWPDKGKKEPALHQAEVELSVLTVLYQLGTDMENTGFDGRY